MAIANALLWANTLSKAAKQSSKKPRLPRTAAAKILAQLIRQQGSLATLLPEALAEFSPQDKSFIKELCYGVCRWYPLLDEIVKSLLQQPLRKKDSDIQAVLLLGIYQLQFTRTPDHAAINESVQTVSALKKVWAKKLVNGVLRRYQREQEALFGAAKVKTPSAHPTWLVQHINQYWPAQAEAIFAANNEHPPLTLRVNQQYASREAYQQQLGEQDVVVEPAPFSEQGLYCQTPLSVTDLPGFAEGAVSVQDESAQLAASLLKLAPGQSVLDACCAPGGKTCHIAESQPDLARLVALDSEERRLVRVHENLARLKCQAKVICGDATQPKMWWDGKAFDRLLLDAPCSATGIIRRQSDIKLLRQPDHIEALATLQLAMLNALWPLLNEGGLLVYATCSILPIENTQVVAKFVSSQEDCIHDKIEADWGIEQEYGRQLLPQINGHDGFYYARLQKVKS